MLRVVVATNLLDVVLAEMRPRPRAALLGMVNARSNEPELEALNASITPPL
jgi:hypothetical protein